MGTRLLSATVTTIRAVARSPRLHLRARPANATTKVFGPAAAMSLIVLAHLPLLARSPIPPLVHATKAKATVVRTHHLATATTILVAAASPKPHPPGQLATATTRDSGLALATWSAAMI